jgi:hypothetical protein
MNRCARVVKVVKIEQRCDCRFAALFATGYCCRSPSRRISRSMFSPSFSFLNVVMLALLKPIVSSPLDAAELTSRPCPHSRLANAKLARPSLAPGPAQPSPIQSYTALKPLDCRCCSWRAWSAVLFVPSFLCFCFTSPPPHDSFNSRAPASQACHSLGSRPLRSFFMFRP